MTRHPGAEPDQGPENDRDIDTGTPIAMLADLREEPAPGFRGRIRSAIERRNLTGQLVEFGWRAPLMMLLEWLGAIFGSVGDTNPKSEGQGHGNDPRDQG